MAPSLVGSESVIPRSWIETVREDNNHDNDKFFAQNATNDRP